LNEIKGSPEKLERFRNEFTHQMYDNVINDEMQKVENYFWHKYVYKLQQRYEIASLIMLC